MKRTNSIKKKMLALSTETLAVIRGGTGVVVADSGSLSCTGPDCGGGTSVNWPLSDICGFKPR